MIRKIILLLMFPNLMLAQNIEKLATYGFENLQELYSEDQYTLFYEDNLFRFPADGLFEVLQKIVPIEKAIHTKIVLLNKGIPIIEMNILTKDFIDFKQGNLVIEKLIENCNFQFTDAQTQSELSKNPSYFKTDLSLRFQLDYTLGNFDNPIRQRVNFQPYLSSDLSKGVNFETYYNVPEFDELGFMEPQIGILRLSNDVKLSKADFLNMSVGFFNYNRLGLSFDYLKFLYKDNLRWNVHMGITRFGRLNKDLIMFYDLSTDLRVDFFSELNYRINKYDMDLSFRYGSYILGDIGYTAQVKRYSGQRFIGLFYKKSNYGTMVGFDFSLPIPIRKYNRKLPIRAKLFDHFYLPYNYRSDSDVGMLYYRGENLISRMTDYFPAIIKKGLLKASKRGR